MKEVHVAVAQNHMATTFQFTIRCKDVDQRRAEAVLKESHRRVAQLEEILSEFKVNSPVFLVNQAIPGTKIAAPDELLEVLERGRWIEHQTGGSFSLTAKARGDFEWDLNNRTLWRNEECHLSLGAIGKGYAIDQVRLIVEQAGFEHYVLNAGGSSLYLKGFASEGKPWVWGWTWQKNCRDGLVFEHRLGTPLGIGISGTEVQGEHILGSNGKVKSSLVACPNAMDADALSTAYFVRGAEPLPSIDRLNMPATAAIHPTGVAEWNGLFRHFWGDIQ